MWEQYVTALQQDSELDHVSISGQIFFFLLLQVIIGNASEGTDVMRVKDIWGR